MTTEFQLSDMTHFTAWICPFVDTLADAIKNLIASPVDWMTNEITLKIPEVENGLHLEHNTGK